MQPGALARNGATVWVLIPLAPQVVHLYLTVNACTKRPSNLLAAARACQARNALRSPDVSFDSMLPWIIAQRDCTTPLRSYIRPRLAHHGYTSTRHIN